MIPLSASLPSYSKQDVLLMFKLGEYTAILLNHPKPMGEIIDKKAAGMIEYVYALLVVKSAQTSELSYVVTLEKTGGIIKEAAAKYGYSDDDDAPFLCSFEESGKHVNYGARVDLLKAEKFASEALSLASKYLGVVERPQLIRGHEKKMRERGNWRVGYRKIIITSYLVAIIVAALIVPWKVEVHTNRVAHQIDRGYAPLWDKPYRNASIDYGRVILTIIAISGVAGIFYILAAKK